MITIPLVMAVEEDVTNLGFWGPVTATIDWCEENYVWTEYIAEFFNTISNSALVILGIYGIYQNFRQRHDNSLLAAWLSMIAVGVGSAAFHCTLRYVEQQCDETPMVWGQLAWNFLLYKEKFSHPKAWRHFVAVLFIIYAAVFAYLHAIFRFTTAFQWHFVFISAFSVRKLVQVYQKMKQPEVGTCHHQGKSQVYSG
uniref:Alkaline ceramidase n=1 Tax=Fibrocapsa japonica TaxID=94617 RepID=A0A7S2XYD0_9STRA|mmetsp:Transcript_22420/g.32540  ORF Transcript_22420/g.32540 Transcript_22420/m.32540 type:complete len:197 (+) Transcript_22420:44-634(+)